MPHDTEKTPPRKSQRLDMLIDEELAVRAIRKSRQFGSLAAVVRALLRAWVEGHIVLHPDAIGRENERAKRKPGKGGE